MVYTLRFFLFSKCSLFHNSNVFGSCIIHVLYAGCAKIKKRNNSGAKRLIVSFRNFVITSKNWSQGRRLWNCWLDWTSSAFCCAGSEQHRSNWIDRSLFVRRYVCVFYLITASVAQTTWRQMVESSWNVMAHGDVREGKWKGNWRMQCVASTLYTTSEHGVPNITTADAHTSAASSRLNWRPRR